MEYDVQPAFLQVMLSLLNDNNNKCVLKEQTVSMRLLKT